LLHEPGQACTSFCFDTPEGPIFGANLDLFIPGDGLVFANRRGIAKENIRQNKSGETLKWVSEYGSVTFNLAGWGFAWGGMNEAGLVLNSLELRASKLPEPDERPPFGSGSLVQYVLDTCGSVEEAIQLGKRVRLEDDGDSPSHFLVADADGNCAAFEYLDGEFVCYTGESLPVKAMSNMRYARALEAFQRGGARWWWSNPGRSAERFAGAAARSASYDANRDTCAVSYAFGTLTRVVVASNTKWNVVYDMARREVWFRSVASPAVKHLSLSAFDLSCEAPLLMLDMNALLEGNVEQSFVPYEHDVNLRVFSTFCARWGIEVSAEGAANLMRHFESFECAP
jgi:choloylglycine hydrolase